MTTTISPRIGMRVILHLADANGRVKREHLPPEFSGVIFAWDSDGVYVSFLDHFGIGKVVHRVPLLAPADNDGGYVMWCRPAPGEPEAGALALPEYLRSLCVSGPIYALPPKPDDSVTKEATKPTTIQLTPAEIQSGLDRVKWAEGLIRQLPENHDGRNSWLLNYGRPAQPGAAVAGGAPGCSLAPMARASLKQDLATLLNIHSAEKLSDTPDFVLAQYLLGALVAFDEAVRARDEWYGAKPGVTVTETARIGNMGHTVTTHSAGGDVEPQPSISVTLPPGAVGFNLYMGATTEEHRVPEVRLPPVDVPGPLSGPKWSLKQVDTASMLAELRSRGCQAVMVAGEDVETLKAQATAWREVVKALDDTLGDWLNKGQSAAHSAVSQIHCQTAQAKAWMGVVGALNEHWPEWTATPTIGPADATLAIAGMAKKARAMPSGTWDDRAKALIAQTKRDGCHSTARTVLLEGDQWLVSVGPNHG